MISIIMRKTDIQRTDTEIELTLPVVDESLDMMDDVNSIGCCVKWYHFHICFFVHCGMERPQQYYQCALHL